LRVNKCEDLLSVAEEKREIVLASLAGDGEDIGIMGILDLAGVFPDGRPVCILRTPSSVKLMSRAVDLIDVVGELNFIGESGGKVVSSISCFSWAGTGSLIDPEAVRFAGTGRPTACPFVALAVDGESKSKSASSLTCQYLETCLVEEVYLPFPSASKMHCV
jgi:hypothetical protein